jgi:hypothetical protein
MKPWKAILLTYVLYVACVCLSHLVHFPLYLVFILVTTLWAAIDSSKHQLRLYRSGVGPFAFFFLCLCFWLAGFPWYLWMRYNIIAGKAELKTNDPRCVSCEELIDPSLLDCPKCGYRQPKGS